VSRRTLKKANLDLRSREAMLQGWRQRSGPHGRATRSGALISSEWQACSKPKMRWPSAAIERARDDGPSRTGSTRALSGMSRPARPRRAPAPGDKANASYTEYKERVITDEMRQWWAFKKPFAARPQGRRCPVVENPVDMFVKAALDTKGLAPAPQADRVTLIRRAYLDLIGLLPSPPRSMRFVSDRSPRAYEDLIERLLASPRYGERWGRFWLDVVRFAESSGFEHDRTWTQLGGIATTSSSPSMRTSLTTASSSSRCARLNSTIRPTTA